MFDTADMFIWLFALFRASALMLVIPVFSMTAFPRLARIGFAALLAWIVAPLAIPALAYPQSLIALVLMVAKEIAIGVMMGLAVRMVFAILDAAAQIIVVEIGLQPSPEFDPSSSADGNPLGTGLFYLGVVVFFSGAQYAVILAFARSFELVPPGLQSVDMNFLPMVVRHSARILELGVLISAPFMAVNFLINLAFSMLGRVVPRLNVFILSYSAQILAGMALLALSAGLFAHYMIQEFGDVPETMLRFLPFSTR
jgi:flagellar biosynthetic protein FliR